MTDGMFDGFAWEPLALGQAAVYYKYTEVARTKTADWLATEGFPGGFEVNGDVPEALAEATRHYIQHLEERRRARIHRSLREDRSTVHDRERERRLQELNAEFEP